MSSNRPVRCFSVEYFDRTLAQYLKMLADSWVLFDPFKKYWTPEGGAREDGVYLLDGDLSLLERDYDWFDAVVFIDKETACLDRLAELRIPNPEARPDWALRFDFFLNNVEKLGALASLVTMPALWAPDSPEGNAVLICRDIRLLQAVVDKVAVTPIVPEAVLRFWPNAMLKYMESGVGLTR